MELIKYLKIGDVILQIEKHYERWKAIVIKVETTFIRDVHKEFQKYTHAYGTQFCKNYKDPITGEMNIEEYKV